MHPVTAQPSGPLSGTIVLPGDKSISHRALMLAGLAVGQSEIHGLLEGEDVLATAAAMRALGAEVERGADGIWRVWGRGIGGLTEPDDVLDLGNSGTGARLLLGLLASHPLTAVVTGDASLRSRPMARVTQPLSACGARFFSRAGERLPLTVIGTAEAMALDYRMPFASAQVKSALLLAGLNAAGTTRIEEPDPSRDHSERMLRHFGAALAVEPLPEPEHPNGRLITLAGQPELTAQNVRVPADPSSAAFPTVAALILPGSEITLPNVGVNPHRTGLFTSLIEMGAEIEFHNRREEAGEPLADLTVRASRLQGVEIPPERVPSMIDEFPILAVAAACASGPTVMRGLAELRVKESDRLAAMAQGLAACGLEIEEGADSLTVLGAGNSSTGGRPPGGARIEARLDHRIAMSFLVLGLASEKPVAIDDGSPIDTSFPGFSQLMRDLGATIAPD